MNRDDKQGDGCAADSASERKAEPKKIYRRPEILYRQPLEASAVVCTAPGAKSNPGMCPSGPINS